jgi:hypothetical protein
MSSDTLNSSLKNILEQYQQSFSTKLFGEEYVELDDLMLIFGLTQEIKAQNKQYWGRELGMCWQRLIVQLCQHTCEDFGEPIKEGADEICDLILGNDAIDTKYRIGSGDSGTLKKFKQDGKRLQELGYNPVLLIFRNDNLPAAITACINGGWTIIQGLEAYNYIQAKTGFELQKWFKKRKSKFIISS